MHQMRESFHYTDVSSLDFLAHATHLLTACAQMRGQAQQRGTWSILHCNTRVEHRSQQESQMADIPWIFQINAKEITLSATFPTGFSHYLLNAHLFFFLYYIYYFCVWYKKSFVHLHIINWHSTPDIHSKLQIIFYLVQLPGLLHLKPFLVPSSTTERNAVWQCPRLYPLSSHYIDKACIIRIIFQSSHKWFADQFNWESSFHWFQPNMLLYLTLSKKDRSCQKVQ